MCQINTSYFMVITCGIIKEFQKTIIGRVGYFSYCQKNYGGCGSDKSSVPPILSITLVSPSSVVKERTFSAFIHSLGARANGASSALSLPFLSPKYLRSC